MKKFFLLSIIFIFNFSFGQKEYQLNNLLEYERSCYRNDSLIHSETIYYVTNAKDNSYIVQLDSINNTQFELRLNDRGGFFSKVKVSRKGFFKAEYINIDCNNVLSSENPYKYQTKNYEYVLLPDTIINGEKLQKYKLTYVGKKKPKKKLSIGTNYYLIKDATEYHLPILKHNTAFEEWKLERSIPNGIFQEKFFVNCKNKVENRLKLKKIIQIDKKIIIKSPCYLFDPDHIFYKGS